MVWHFINGAVLVYAFLLYDRLAGAPWLRGIEWGLILWFLAQVVAMPVMGGGLFSSAMPQTAMAVAGSFVAHAIYGAILGAIAAPERVPFGGSVVRTS